MFTRRRKWLSVAMVAAMLVCLVMASLLLQQITGVARTGTSKEPLPPEVHVHKEKGNSHRLIPRRRPTGGVNVNVSNLSPVPVGKPWSLSKAGYGRNSQQAFSNMATRDYRLGRLTSRCPDIDGYSYKDWPQLPLYYSNNRLNVTYCITRSLDDLFWLNAFKVFKETSSNKTLLERKLYDPEAMLYVGDKVTFRNIRRYNSKTIVVVRNPYERFYFGFIESIKYNPENECQLLTFQEHLDDIISGVKLRFHTGTHLYAPLNPACRPCDVKLLAIVKPATFVRDVDFILRSLHLSKNHQKLIKSIATDPEVYVPLITDRLVSAPAIWQCGDKQDLGQHVWKTLQHLGILHDNATFPAEFNKFDVSLHRARFQKVIMTAIHNWPMSKVDKEKQKHAALAKAYSDIKQETIQYLQKLYWFDFHTFQYDILPPS